MGREGLFRNNGRRQGPLCVQMDFSGALGRLNVYKFTCCGVSAALLVLGSAFLVVATCFSPT